MRCANPQCKVESNYLRDGGLYTIDDLIPPSGQPQRRFIWLCSQCSQDFVVETWRPAGQQLVMKVPAPAPANCSLSPRLLPTQHVQPRRSLPPRATLLREARYRADA